MHGITASIQTDHAFYVFYAGFRPPLACHLLVTPSYKKDSAKSEGLICLQVNLNE